MFDVINNLIEMINPFICKLWKQQEIIKKMISLYRISIPTNIPCGKLRLCPNSWPIMTVGPLIAVASHWIENK